MLSRGDACPGAPVRPSLRRWTILAVVLKLCIALSLLVLFNEHRPAPRFRFFSDSGDVADYVQPAENLLRSGVYTTDISNPMGMVWRMPGYALTFLPFRALFSEDTAKGLLVGLQLLIECAALFCVGDVASRLTGSSVSGAWALALYTASMFVTIFSCTIIPDGLAANLTVILAWLLLRNRGHIGPGLALAAGTIYIYLVFLRPYLAPLVIPFAWFIFANAGTPSRGRWLRLIAFLTVPAIAETAWVVRNYVQVGEPILFHLAGIRLPPPEAALRRWIISFGGDIIWWRPGSEQAWFVPKSPYYDPEWTLPPAPLTATCPLTRVLEGRRHYLAYGLTAGTEKEIHGRLVTSIFNSCRTAYEEEKPFDHHVLARLRLIRSFLVHAPPLPLPRFSTLDRGDPRFWLKIVSVGVYAATIILGCCGLVLLLVRPGPERWFIAAVTAYLLLVFPFVLRFIENRYLAAAHPFLAIAAGVACHAIQMALSGPRHPPINPIAS
jgi:hypothetical protein